MILTVAATEFEMEPILDQLDRTGSPSLICGVGPVESCLNLARYLEKNHSLVKAVVNAGIAGAYLQKRNESPDMLDICLARTEVAGDFGICYPLRIDDISPEMAQRHCFKLDSKLLETAEIVLKMENIKYVTGGFVTVNCVSGTTARGDILSRKFGAICENMEGAALARVCEEFSLPFLEVRCISNFVENRDPSRWAMAEACQKGGKAAAAIIKHLEE